MAEATHIYTKPEATSSPPHRKQGNLLWVVWSAQHVSAGVAPHGVTPYSTKVMSKDLNKLLSPGCVTKAP